MNSKEHSSLTDFVKDDLKSIGGGLVGLYLAAVSAATTVAIWPTYARMGLEGELSDEITREPEPSKPTPFEQAMVGVFSAVEPPLRYIVGASILWDLTDGKIDQKGSYFYLIPMGISLVYEGFRYMKNRSTAPAPVAL